MKKDFLKNRLFVLLLVAGSGLTLSSCGDDYDDAWVKEVTTDLENRVTALEEWQKTVNSQISSLQGIISGLENTDYVTKGTQLTDGTGYVISFQNSGDVTILNGKDGKTPVIGVKQDTDGNYYWTLDGEWLTDGTSKMSVTGKDAIAPQVRINSETNMWEISTDGGKTWTSTNVKATGDKVDKGDNGDNGSTGSNGGSMFSSIDTSNSEYVELTLASDGTKIQLPYYNGELRITNYIIPVKVSGDIELEVVLPDDLTESDYQDIFATVTPTNGSVGTRSASGWSVEIRNRPSFNSAGKLSHKNLSLLVSVDETVAYGDHALVSVYLNYQDGKQKTASYLVKCVKMKLDSGEDLQKILASDEYTVVTLTQDITTQSQFTASNKKGVAIDLNGHTVSNSKDLGSDAAIISVSISTSIGYSYSLYDNSKEQAGKVTAKQNDCYAVAVQDGAYVSIWGGTYTGNISAVYVKKGKAYIYDGVFDIDKKNEKADASGTVDPYAYLLGVDETSYENGEVQVYVYGGIFVGFNPADCYGDKHYNFVPEAFCESVKTTYNGKDAWKVQWKSN